MGARIRTIKPEFWGDEKVGRLTRLARLTFLGLISVASDDEGRCRGNPRGVRSTVYPLDGDIPVEEIAEHLEQIAATGLVTLYSVKGEPYIQIVNFKRHQRINRATASQLPPASAPPPVSNKLTECSLRPHHSIGEDSVSSQHILIEPSKSAPTVVESSVKEKEESPLAVLPPVAVNVPSRSAAPLSNPFPKDLCDRLYEGWLSTGHSVEYSRFRKALKPLFPNSGHRFEEAAIARAIVAFNEAADGVSPDKSQFWHINKFVDDVGRWVRLGAMPLTDLNGLTERGRAAMGAGL